MRHEPTQIRFSSRYPAVLASVLLLVVIASPLAVLALLMPRPWGYIWAVLVLLGTLAAILRSRRIALVVAPDGWRSYWLPWKSIESIGQTSRSMLGQGPGEETIEFELRGGRSVHSQATFGPPASHRVMLEEMAKYASKWGIQMPEREDTIAQ